MRCCAILTTGIDPNTYLGQSVKGVGQAEHRGTGSVVQVISGKEKEAKEEIGSEKVFTRKRVNSILSSFTQFHQSPKEEAKQIKKESENETHTISEGRRQSPERRASQ